jgi:hypothetical protein
MNNLKVKTSDYKQELDYNEWVMKFNFGGDYIKPTQYYQGNPSWSDRQQNENVIDNLFSYFTKIRTFFFQF